MKIIMLSSTFPYPPTRGRKQLRTFHLLKYLSKSHQVTLVTQRNETISDEEIEALEKQVTELVIFPPEKASESAGIIEKAKRLGTFIQQGTPPEILKAYSSAIANWVKKAVKEGGFDVITCEDSTNEIYINSQWREQLGTVLNVHSSKYGIYKQQLETGDSENELKDQINLGVLRRYEQNYLSKFAQIVTVTQKDKRLLKELEPESTIKVIPNGVDLAKFPRRVTNQGGQRIVFVGNMDRPANINAARFLALEIFPAVRERYPEATLELVGANPVEEIQALNSLPGIKVTGEVASVVEYLHWATVCVVPMRQGFGLKNRTLEAMAMGVPVVGSDRALSGLKVDGADVPLRAMRANTLEEYVYAIGRLFAEPKLRDKLSENGRSLVENEYTWEKVGQRYEQVLLDAFKSVNS
ncbi:MAG: glycosyltransferase family 4 protein [Xenococcaceae cyanobacterium MO_188.B32]|nr:glycosyltransferase family 4 protein [Xenococcaceae cyanobacterium MO_188.B32]